MHLDEDSQAQRILEEARAYKERTVLEAQGEVARFARLLPEYKAAPQITKERLYIESMERVLSHTRKVLVNDRSNSLMVLPLDQLLRGGQSGNARGQNNTEAQHRRTNPATPASKPKPEKTQWTLQPNKRSRPYSRLPRWPEQARTGTRW